MKRRILFLILIVCLFISGCSNGFAKREYNSDDKIAKKEDHYAKQNSVFNPIVGGCRLTVGEFDGRETLWTFMAEEEQEMEVSIYLSLSSGQVKIVYIDAGGTITNLLESTTEGTVGIVETKNVLLKNGENRFKVVGYDCRDLDVELLFDGIRREYKGL